MPTAALQANLDALRRRDPELAGRLDQAEPAPLEWADARTGRLTATLPQAGRAIALASRYDPDKEAQKLVGDIDHAATACVVVLGLGVGHHVRRLHRDMAGRGVLVVFEPDLALLRAVLERVDLAAVLAEHRTVLVTDGIDRPGLLKRLEPFAGTITQGLKFVTHPPTRQRFADGLRDFSKIVTETLAYCRTNIATALVNSSRTCSNLCHNLDAYAAGPTTNELYKAAEGFPAVCVAAGPSLVKNVDLLRDPAVRRNLVVIAVQTALRPLLDRGVKPDFVTALDYSPICTRFYENLPDLPDVTLVAEPKAHPSIFDAFPGPTRILRSEFNDQLLGHPARGGMARPIQPIPSGATVAHLSFYLAQHLGCDPILFIGQDLGFSDGLYYAPGTAVHQVWSSELSPYNTLEMMEYTRIARMRGHLRRTDDIHGRSIYTDEQMATYLKQFERDFASASETIIDATEGGVPKAHTTRMPLADALARHATRPIPDLPIPPRTLDGQRLEKLQRLVDEQIDEIVELQRETRATIPLLRRMLKHQRDPRRMEKLFKDLNKHQARVQRELQRAFQTVTSINTVGAFRRARADRAIVHQANDGYERQAQQIERDLDNLVFLDQACDDALDMFRSTAARIASKVQAVPQEPAAAA